VYYSSLLVIATSLWLAVRPLDTVR